MQYRTVTCLSHDPNAICTADEKLKPSDQRPCNTTCGDWLVSHWSSSVSNVCQSHTDARECQFCVVHSIALQSVQVVQKYFSLLVWRKAWYQVEAILRQLVLHRREFSLSTFSQEVDLYGFILCSVFRHMWQCQHPSQRFVQHHPMWSRSTAIIDASLYSTWLHEQLDVDHKQS